MLKELCTIYCNQFAQNSLVSDICSIFPDFIHLEVCNRENDHQRSLEVTREPFAKCSDLSAENHATFMPLTLEMNDPIIISK